MTKLRNRNKTKRRNCVTKRRSHRTRNQRGGNLLHKLSFGNFGTPDDPVPVATGLSDTEPKSYWSVMDWFKGPTDSENAEITGTIKSTVGTTVDNLNTEVGNAATRAKNFIAEEASAITENVKKTVGYDDSGQGNDTLIGSPEPTPPPSPPSPVTGGKTRKHKHAKKPVGYGKYTLIGTPDPTPPPSPPTPPKTGGKTRKHNKKGGTNLGLLYYATPVEQSILIKGGKRHKHTCCKNKRKGKCKRHNVSCIKK